MVFTNISRKKSMYGILTLKGLIGFQVNLRKGGRFYRPPPFRKSFESYWKVLSFCFNRAFLALSKDGISMSKNI